MAKVVGDGPGVPISSARMWNRMQIQKRPSAQPGSVFLCLIVFPMGAGVPTAVTAQTAACPPAATDALAAVYLPCQIDSAPRPALDVAPPESLGILNCSGALLDIIVASDGTVGRVAVRAGAPRSEDCLDHVAKWQFAPGRVDGKAVPVRVPIQVQVQPPRPRDLLWDPLVEWANRADTIALTLEWREPAVGMFRPLPESAEDSALAAVVRDVAVRGLEAETHHYCLDLTGREHRFDRVARLIGELQRPLHARQGCPSIRTQRDGTVRYVTNPPYLHLGIRGRLRRAARDSYVIDAWYGRGLGGAGLLCRASRARPTWRVRCAVVWEA